MINAYLLRTSDNGEQTNGSLFVYEGDTLIGRFSTLELPWKGNQRRASCIPKGTDQVTYRKAEESGSFEYDHFHVQDVEGRTDITRSAKSLNRLREMAPEGFNLTIV